MTLLHDRYRLERVLGQGSTGVAYLATDTKSGAQVVVKRFHAGAGEGWQREARALQALDHPAIPPFLDAFEAEVALVRHPHLVQGYVEGLSLAEWARARARTRYEVLESLAQVLEVLVYLQSLAPPVLHRDVKPGNVLVRPDGRIALVDFGSAVPDLARTFGRTLAAGTLGYQAPEQVQGAPVPASDVYSAAAMALELLTGAPLVEMLGNDATLRWQTHAGRLGELEAWFRRALAPVEQRFVTALEALEGLAPALPVGRVAAEADPEVRARGWLDVAVRAQALGDDARLGRALAGVRAAVGHDAGAYRWLGEASAALGPVAEVRAWRDALADALAEDDAGRVDDALAALEAAPDEALDLLLAVGQRLGVRLGSREGGGAALAQLRAALAPALEARAQLRHAHSEAAALGVTLPANDGDPAWAVRQRAALAELAVAQAAHAARTAAWGREVGSPPAFGDPERAAWTRAAGADLARAAAWRASPGARGAVPWPLTDAELTEVRAADFDVRRRAREAREAVQAEEQARHVAAAWTAVLAAAHAESQAHESPKAADARARAGQGRSFGDAPTAREAHAAAAARSRDASAAFDTVFAPLLDVVRTRAPIVAAAAVRVLPPPLRANVAQEFAPDMFGTEEHRLGRLVLSFARVSPGRFCMGSPVTESERSADEDPHDVVLTRAFAMATTPVTQELWTAVIGSNPAYCSHGPEAPQRPVEQVSWFDAVHFCNTLSVKQGLRPAYRVGPGDAPEVAWDLDADGFRLPTEAEWECAARAGTTYVYAGGDDLDVVAWHGGNSDDTTHPVGRKRANAWGLFDMSGNVWEWCWDWRGEYLAEGALDPTGPQTGACRVHRGGGWLYEPQHARVAYRNYGEPSGRDYYFGLRLARTVL